MIIVLILASTSLGNLAETRGARNLMSTLTSQAFLLAEKKKSYIRSPGCQVVWLRDCIAEYWSVGGSNVFEKIFTARFTVSTELATSYTDN